MVYPYDTLVASELSSRAPTSHWRLKLVRMSSVAALIAVAVFVMKIIDQQWSTGTQVRSMLGFGGPRPPYCLHSTLKSCLDTQVVLEKEQEEQARLKKAVRLMTSPVPRSVPSMEEFLNSSLNNCTCKLYGTCGGGENTLVTALFDLNLTDGNGGENLHPRAAKEDRTFGGFYVRHLIRLVKKYAKTPKVVYVQKGYGATIAAAHPGGFTSPYLCLVEMDLTDLPVYAYAPDWARATLVSWRKYRNLPGFDSIETTLPTYNILIASKVAALGSAAAQNVFGSTRFAWIDAGIHLPQAEFLPIDSDHIDIRTCGGKVCLPFNYNPFCEGKFWKRHGKNNKTWITIHCRQCASATVFSGSREAVLRWVDPFYAYMQEYLREDVITGEQGIMQLLWMNRPDIVEAQLCQGWSFCSGFLLGGHRLSNASAYVWRENYSCQKERLAIWHTS